MLKNNKGITLASLVITIIILLILASVATVSGMGAVDYMKFNNAKAQIQNMQSHVNSWYEESKNNEEILNYGKDISTAGLNATLVDNTLYDEETETSDDTGYRYFSSDYIKNDLDIDGISYNFLINISTRTVLIYGGIEYKGETYYSIENFGIENVEYIPVQGNIECNEKIEYKDDKAYIVISDIEIPGNINKYEIKYKNLTNKDKHWTVATSDMKNQNDIWKLPVEINYEYQVQILTASSKITKKEFTREIPTQLEYLRQSQEPATKNLTLTDENGHIISIPKNFYISKDSPTLVTEGMIIQDSDENEYVWIPVFEYDKDNCTWGVDYSSVASEKDYTAIKAALEGYISSYSDSKFTDTWWGDAETCQYAYGYYESSDTAQENLIYYTNGNMTEEEYGNLYNNMLSSVYKYGGFYIGRYEMGIGVVSSVKEAQSISRTAKGYTVSSDNKTNEKPTIEGMALPISKRDSVIYTHITQNQAQMLAVELGKGENYSNVTTSILFGIQFNLVCKFIENFDDNPNNTTTEEKKIEWLTKNTYGKLWGNQSNSEYTMDRGFYVGKNGTGTTTTWNEKGTKPADETYQWLCTSGACDEFSSLNIFDFTGNEWEWTLEAYSGTAGVCVNRGSAYTFAGAATTKGAGHPYVGSLNSGSRCCFFINNAE